MKASINCIRLIHSFEKCILIAYQDSTGVWTIGWGNTYYEDGTRVKKGDKITQKRADELFSNILTKFELKVSNYLKVQVTQNVFDGMVCFTYNCGGSYYSKSLKKYVPFDVWNYINMQKSIKDIAAKLRVTATTAGGVKLKGLVRRRNSEATLIETGKVILG